MKINTLNSPNFNSKHIDIRKADDIARHVNRSFPMVKPTYAMQNWKILNTHRDDGFQLRTDYYRKYQGRVFAMRAEYMSEDSDSPFYIDIMDCVDFRKTGNCYESAYLTLGSLFASGYRKAIKASPEVEVIAFDKTTKQAVASKTFPLDHTCVLTSMDNPKRKDIDDLVVIDSWLNKAMTVADAKQEYIKFLSKRQLGSNFFEVQERLKRRLGWKLENGSLVQNKDFNINNYECKYRINFVCDQKFNPEEIEEFSQEVSKNYPRLKLDAYI